MSFLSGICQRRSKGPCRLPSPTFETPRPPWTRGARCSAPASRRRWCPWPRRDSGRPGWPRSIRGPGPRAGGGPQGPPRFPASPSRWWRRRSPRCWYNDPRQSENDRLLELSRYSVILLLRSPSDQAGWPRSWSPSGRSWRPCVRASWEPSARWGSGHPAWAANFPRPAEVSVVKMFLQNIDS